MTSTQDDGWIKMTERKPTEGDGSIWAYYDGGTITMLTGVTIEIHATHWKPATLPAPPAKELTQAEKDQEAYLGWYRNSTTQENCLHSWHAALAWERKQNAEDLRNVIGLGFTHSAIQDPQALHRLRRRCGLDT